MKLGLNGKSLKAGTPQCDEKQQQICAHLRNIYIRCQYFVLPCRTSSGLLCFSYIDDINMKTMETMDHTANVVPRVFLRHTRKPNEHPGVTNGRFWASPYVIPNSFRLHSNGLFLIFRCTDSYETQNVQRNII